MQPESPNPNFDFIMKDAPKSKRNFGLPALPKPALIAIGVVIIIFLIIIASSLFGGSGNSNTDKIYGLLSDAGKIVATSDEAISSAHDPDTINVAATTKAVLTGEQQQLQKYISDKGIKIDSKKISGTIDTDVEAKLKTAATSNNYDQVFLNYLKSAMNSYQADLQSNYQTADSNLKTILSNAYNNNAIILNSKQLH